MRKILLLCFLLPIYSFSGPMGVPQGIYPYQNPRLKDHSGDFPFPTERSFHIKCDHKITFWDTQFDPSLVKEGDTIFLMDWYLPWFIRDVHPNIHHRYILVSNDTDGWHPDPGIDSQEVKKILYDPKVAAWFCKNSIISNHPKLFQIPVGQNIIYWDNFHEDLEKKHLIDLVTRKNFEKSHLIFLNLTVRNDGHRDVIYNLFRNKPYVFFKELGINRMTFWDELAKSMFTFCPPGIGIDTVRHWEAFVLNSIPVMVHTPLDNLYEGLPCLYVDRWEDVNENLLVKKYDEITDQIRQGKLSNEKAFFDYWWNKIKDVQKQVRSNKWKGNLLETTKFDQGKINALNEIFVENPKHNQYELFVYGHLVGLRAIQMTHHYAYFDRVYLSDLFTHQYKDWHVRFLKEYAQDHSIFNREDKLTPVEKWDLINKLRENKGRNINTRVFMDLTYHRFDFKKELESFYDQLATNMIICGNMLSDTYVMEQLEKFSSSRNLNMKIKGDFWYFTKR